jgi:hypothetical protein
VDALPGLQSLAGTAALLPTATGFRAFSARTAAFVPLASVGGVAQTNTAAAPALVYDNASVHCFDARRDRWLSLPRNGTGQPTVGIWRTAALVLDGNDAIGFGTQSGTLARTTLPEPVLAWRANSESLGLTMQGHLAAFSALPVPTSLWQYPDFRRAFVTGAPFRLHVRLLPGDAAFFGGGLLAAAPQSFPGLGELLLDPASTHVQFVLPEVDADRAVMTIPVPDSPALRGASFWFQSLVLPSSGAPYLSDAATLFIG